MELDQSRAPYLEALIEYDRRGVARFMVPGHKGGHGTDPGLAEAVGIRALEMDIPAGIQGIDTGQDPAENHFVHAQLLAAEAWGAKRSWFLVNGGSGGNHAISMTLAQMGGKVVIQRNAHSSAVDGMILSGLLPHFVSPEVDSELGIAHCMTPEALEEALDEVPDAVAAMVTSPTYFGAVADVASLVEIAHARGLPLIVDEAWGAHMRFCDELPDSALSCGADMVLSSTHKIVGSITQSAVLHLGNDGKLIDEAVVDRAVSVIESTSPNALLTASIDAMRRLAATRGQELLAETVSSLATLRERIREIDGLDVVDERIAGRPGVFAYDPLRLVIDVRGTGATGHRVAHLMHESDTIDLELVAENVVVALFGMGEHAAETGEALVVGLQHAVEALDENGEPEGRFAEPPPWGPIVMSPRDAFLAPQEVVAFEEAEGRISAESLAAYPPGVPNVLPGERITAPTLGYIADSLAHGGWIRGAQDRTVKTLRVVVE